jgi:hypothetical protein
MRNIFVSILAAIAILSASVELVKAQDSVKNTVVKKTVVKPATTKPAAIDPVTGKPVIPINPKTGKPYSRYGYGYYSKHNAKAAQTADSLKKAAPLKTAVTPAVVPPADSAVAAAPADKSLNGQYNYLLNKIYPYQQPLVAALWKNVIDTLNATHRQLADAQAKAAELNKTISGLQADSTAKSESVSKADEINLLGISTSKSTYNLVMWGLVIVFGVTAIIVIARSGSLKHEAVHRTSLYNELEEEYKAFKTKANEKEKKLARELQTERNKIDELMGRG